MKLALAEMYVEGVCTLRRPADQLLLHPDQPLRREVGCGFRDQKKKSFGGRFWIA